MLRQDGNLQGSHHSVSCAACDGDGSHRTSDMKDNDAAAPHLVALPKAFLFHSKKDEPDLPVLLTIVMAEMTPTRSLPKRYEEPRRKRCKTKNKRYFHFPSVSLFLPTDMRNGYHSSVRDGRQEQTPRPTPTPTTAFGGRSMTRVPCGVQHTLLQGCH